LLNRDDPYENTETKHKIIQQKDDQVRKSTDYRTDDSCAFRFVIWNSKLTRCNKN